MRLFGFQIGRDEELNRDARQEPQNKTFALPQSEDGAVTVAGTLALTNGGTGATTVSGAQTNLQVDPAGTAVAMAIALG